MSLFAARESLVARLLASRILAYLAKISYALYIIHGCLMFSWLGTGATTWVKYAKRPLLFLVTFSLAHFSTNHYERYFIELGRRLTRTRRSDPAAPTAERDGRPLSILIVSEHASTRFGGEAALAFHYFRVMRTRGLDVRLLTHARVRDELLAAFPEEHERLLFIEDSPVQRWLWRAGKPLPRRLASFTTGFASRIITQLAQRRVARRLVREAGVQVVHQPMPVSPREPSLLFDLGAPVLIGPLNGNMQFPPGFRPRDGVWVSAIERVGRAASGLMNTLFPGKRRAAIVLVANERTAQALPTRRLGKIVLLAENGVDLSLFTSTARQLPAPGERRPTRFVYMGRLVDWKAVDLLLQAFAQARDHADISLTIIGDGPERAPLEMLAARLGIIEAAPGHAGKVHFRRVAQPGRMRRAASPQRRLGPAQSLGVRRRRRPRGHGLQHACHRNGLGGAGGLPGRHIRAAGSSRLARSRRHGLCEGHAGNEHRSTTPPGDGRRRAQPRGERTSTGNERSTSCWRCINRRRPPGRRYRMLQHEPANDRICTMNPSMTATHRKAYCVMGAGSLPYARLSIESLCANSIDDLDLKVITDDEEDKTRIVAAMHEISIAARHVWSVHSKPELDVLAQEQYVGLPELHRLRSGHPCWRKITDPLLLAADGEEILLLDPDLYFPNRFRFEPTPNTGVLLMWQAPHCLLPPESVMNAYDGDVALAHHVDIGVGQLRRNLDMAWLNDLVKTLRGDGELPRKMHIEAIIWSAVALRVGGGYLDPTHWHCWANSQWKRLALKVKIPGARLLAHENFADMKCFHGGGPAKWWIPGFIQQGSMPKPRVLDEHAAPKPFEELTREAYLAGQRWKSLARRLGYYAIFKS